MLSPPPISRTRTRLLLTRIPDSWRWARIDVVVRLFPFAVAYVAAYVFSGRAGWLGFDLGDVAAQLLFALIAAPLLFAAAIAVQLWLTRRRGVLAVPADGGDAAFQAGYYFLNGPVEEAFFRGLVQGALTAFWTAPGGFVVGTAAYVLYHRLGRWTWPDTFATALLGVPLGLAFWLLPGPPSLLGVSLAHVAATCGFLGPGPLLLRRMRLL
jgi:membrane protease YdiL (CAAX protease family)